MFFRIFLSFICLSFVSSCWRVGERAEETAPFTLTDGSVAKQCRSINYKKIFISYFNQELMAGEASLQKQNKQIDGAIFCIKQFLKQIVSEIRGKQTDSLDREELVTLLKHPLAQEPLKDLGIDVKPLIENLTDPENSDEWMQIKNFTIEVIKNFSSGLTSEKVCGKSRDRFYKWEIEVLISSLDTTGNWLKDINVISEKVYKNLVENIIESGSSFSNEYIALSSEEKYTIKKELLSIPEHTVRYFLPALSESFLDKAPDLSEYLTESAILLNESFGKLFSVDFWSKEAKRKKKAEKLLSSISFILENNKISSSDFLEKSDMLLMVMEISLANTLFNAYNKDEDSKVTEKEFLDSTTCLEDFLLPTFKNNKDYFYYFIEFQQNPEKHKVDVAWELFWDKLIHDEPLSLTRDDFFKLITVLFSGFFPYDMTKQPEEEPIAQPE